MRNTDSNANSTPGAARMARPSSRVWSWVLVPLVLTASLAVASVSPWLVPPYLILMVSVLFGPAASRSETARVLAVPPRPESSPAPSEPLHPEPPEPNDAPKTGSPLADAPDASTATATKTRKRKSRTRSKAKEPQGVTPEPPAASWVCVGPGKYVRIEEAEPTDPEATGSTEPQPNDPHSELAGANLLDPVHPVVEIKSVAPVDPEPFQETDETSHHEPINELPADEPTEARFTYHNPFLGNEIDANGDETSFVPDSPPVIEPFRLDYSTDATVHESDQSQWNLEDREFGDAHHGLAQPDPVLDIPAPEPDQVPEPVRLDAGPDRPDIDLPANEFELLGMSEVVQDQGSVYAHEPEDD
ncbi:MAG: hypothetical protein ABI353_02745, partial [Isosphaeraceae bacterium]